MDQFSPNSLAMPSRRQGISLTALIDVVFILLLFFMLTSTFTRWTAVDLLSPVSSKQVVASKPELALLKENGSLIFQSSGYVVNDVSHIAAEQLGAFDMTKPLVLMVEEPLNVQTIVSTLEQLQQLGWQQVSLGDVLASKGNQ